MSTIKEIFNSINQSAGWVCADYLVNQVQTGYRLSNADLFRLSNLLIKNNMLVDTNHFTFNGDEDCVDDINPAAFIR